jgi:transcription elongation factor Elf1
MKLLGKLVCLFAGHKRGKFVREDSFHDRYYACPRCNHETRYKAKSQNQGTPGDQA